MFHRSNSAASPSARARALLLASIAALVVTSFDAHAAPAAAQSAGATSQQLAPADGAEFGARKRWRAGRGNSAAGLAMMGMMIGAVGGIIAAQQRRDAYEAAYNRRAYGYSYGSPYGQPHPYVHHRPHVYHHPYAYR